MRYDAAIAPLIATVRQAHNDRVHEPGESGPTLHGLLVEQAQTLEELVGAMAKIEAMVRFAAGLTKLESKDGRFYLRFLDRPEQAWVEITDSDIVIDDAGNIGLRF
ncbi:hypothetical protein [Trueperella abortisuis]|uniref:hypothetical protein n=1 Tax=Trueperella abortisuis TaxID=445930 RepID=UPI0028934DEE|nr:hypothetical protein [Trueperella abortisuis]